MEIPAKAKIISLFLKLTVFLSATVGILLSAHAAKGTFMSGGRVFMFFTIQSNIAIATIAFVGAILLLKKIEGNVWSVVQFVGTVSITLTGVVFTFVLAPTLGDAAWNAQNILTHIVVPITAILDFFVIGAYCKIRKRSVFYVILPPGLYALYAGIGYAAGWEFVDGINYPYFFLNWGSPAGAFGFASELPFMGCVWWILALLLFLIALGYSYLLIVDRIRKKLTNRNLRSEHADI